MHLKTIQGLLLVSTAYWAVFPLGGAPVFAAVALLVLLTVWQKQRQAAQAIGPSLAGRLAPRQWRWLLRHAFFYVTPGAALAWASMCRLTAYLALVMAPWIFLRATIALQGRLLWLLVACAGLCTLGAWAGLTVDVESRVNDAGTDEDKLLHAQVQRFVEGLRLEGAWPPRLAA